VEAFHPEDGAQHDSRWFRGDNRWREQALVSGLLCKKPSVYTLIRGRSVGCVLCLCTAGFLMSTGCFNSAVAARFTIVRVGGSFCKPITWLSLNLAGYGVRSVSSMLLNCSSAASRFFVISDAMVSGGGSLFEFSRLSSSSKVMSRFALSRFMSSS